MKRTLLVVSMLVWAGGAGAAKKKHPLPKPKPAPEQPAPEQPAPDAAPAEAATSSQAGPSEPAQAPPSTPPAAAKPMAATPVPVEKSKVDVELLNAEYNAIRDELFRSRAKAELLGAALFKTRMVATFQYKAQRAWPLKKVTLRLDDRPVYSADAPNAADDPLKLYDGFTVPGRHTVALHVECGATGDSRLAYTAEDSFTFDVADGRQAKVELWVDETGDGPQPLATKKEGTFDLRVKARVRSLEQATK